MAIVGSSMSTEPWDFFDKSEFKCKCGCGTNNISNTLVNMLDVARRIAGVSFIINSGVRCGKHNALVAASPTSSHVSGWAVDIQVSSSTARSKMIKALIAVGFNRMGIADTFIHVDIDPGKPEDVTWTY